MRRLSTRAAGLLILILGVWGGLIPFIGPYFHYALGPDRSWAWTSGRLYLDVLPGVAAIVSGILLLGHGPRPAGRLGALIALAAGIWFAAGPDVSLLWNSAGAEGVAHGARGLRALELLGYHTGLGAVIAALGGYAFPRLALPADAAAGAAAATPAVVEYRTPARPRRARAAEPEPVATRRVVPQEPAYVEPAQPPATAVPAAGPASSAAAPVEPTERPLGAPAASSAPVLEYRTPGEPGRASEPIAPEDAAGAGAPSDPYVAGRSSTTTGAGTTSEPQPADPAATDADASTAPAPDRVHVRRRRRGVLNVFSRR